jgi:hypothetical protein
MANINIIVFGTKRVFTEPVTALVHSLIELGHNVTKINWYQTITDKYNIDEINIYIGDFRRRNLLIDKDKYNIYICTEQYLSCGINSVKTYYNECINKFNVVIDMFKYNILKPKSTIIHRYCPIGYSPVFEQNYNPNIKKCINLLHIGELQINNSSIQNIKKICTRKISFGLERDTFIQQARINLSLQTFHKIGYEWTHYRMLFVVGLRGFLMAEPHIDYGPYTPGKHFIIFNNLFEEYNEWCTNSKRRKEFSINSYEDIKENHKYTMYLDKALKGLL